MWAVLVDLVAILLVFAGLDRRERLRARKSQPQLSP
jgi:hypothetical protein